MVTEEEFEQISEDEKEKLVELLCSEGWKGKAAWKAAEDPDNWEVDEKGNIRPNVIASSDQYD
jgi:hypothetical protein